MSASHIHTLTVSMKLNCCEATRLRSRLIWVACARSQVHLRILDVCISPHLPRFPLIEIEALSIRKNLDHQSGIDRCGRENPVSCRKPRFRGRRV